MFWDNQVNNENIKKGRLCPMREMPKTGYYFYYSFYNCYILYLSNNDIIINIKTIIIMTNNNNNNNNNNNHNIRLDTWHNIILQTCGVNRCLDERS